MIMLLFGIILIGFLIENKLAIYRRKQLKHVIYVNGTRGKSTVTRLIDAGLRRSGYRVFCKTTGTVPLIIGTDNIERQIKRNGSPNIKEQLWVLKRANKDKADILVCECMAISPELQRISQDRMLMSNMGVITNVRHDHLEEMGRTLPEICEALSNTIPENGVLFTADADAYPQLKINAERRHTETVLAEISESVKHELFGENLALALSVCEHLGVAREVALEGMLNYKKDPYALSLFRLKNDGIFVNGFSINDPDSTAYVYNMLMARDLFKDRQCILLINSRSDRLSRTKQMIELAINLKPTEVWLMGSMNLMMQKRLKRNFMTVSHFNTVDAMDFKKVNRHFFVFAVGNIANDGMQLIRKIEMEGHEIG
ncbi:poly-gamma-glutamate synthase PgsB [Fusibacter ferrireducens]|nr:poly-gamma-glutamate synthase PgsB [Fusibacter ferrireducens]